MEVTNTRFEAYFVNDSNYYVRYAVYSAEGSIWNLLYEGEADDYAASLVEKFQGPELQTYVLTKDHDYFQLVSEYTRMWRVVTRDKLEALKDAYGLYGKDAYEALPPNVFEYTPEIVHSEEGVYPEQIPVLLAITGDPGDGVLDGNHQCWCTGSGV